MCNMFIWYHLLRILLKACWWCMQPAPHHLHRPPHHCHHLHLHLHRPPTQVRDAPDLCLGDIHTHGAERAPYMSKPCICDMPLALLKKHAGCLANVSLIGIAFGCCCGKPCPVSASLHAATVLRFHHFVFEPCVLARMQAVPCSLYHTQHPQAPRASFPTASDQMPGVHATLQSALFPTTPLAPLARAAKPPALTLCWTWEVQLLWLTVSGCRHAQLAAKSKHS